MGLPVGAFVNLVLFPLQFNDTPTTIYAISMAWFRQWQLFARGLTTDDPGPIQNKSIAIQGDTSVPLRNVRPFSDYAQINANLWHFFHGIYGGGPEIVLQGNPVPPPAAVTKMHQSQEEHPAKPHQQQQQHHSQQQQHKVQVIQKFFFEKLCINV